MSDFYIDIGSQSNYQTTMLSIGINSNQGNIPEDNNPEASYFIVEKGTISVPGSNTIINEFGIVTPILVEQSGYWLIIRINGQSSLINKLSQSNTTPKPTIYQPILTANGNIGWSSDNGNTFISDILLNSIGSIS